MTSMPLLQSIADAQAAAARALDAAEALDKRAGELAEAIRNAPTARDFTIRLGEKDHVISEREALTFGAACFVALGSGQQVTLKTKAGEILEVKDGDMYVAAQAILAQAAA